MGGGGEVAEAEGGRADEGARGGRACGLSGRRTRWVRGGGVGRWRGQRGRGGGERRRRPGAAAVRVLREKKKRGERYGPARGSAGRTMGGRTTGGALPLRVF
jgi:hypothetical protein